MTRPVFRKSSYSSDSWNCVEVATTPGEVLVRDSKNPDGPVLAIGLGAWMEFITVLKGENR